MGFDNSEIVLLSALGGLGASLVCFSLLAGGLRASTARRLAVFIGDGSLESGRTARSVSVRRWLAAWTARIGAHSAPVRAFLVAFILAVGVASAAAGSSAEPGGPRPRPGGRGSTIEVFEDTAARLRDLCARQESCDLSKPDGSA